MENSKDSKGTHNSLSAFGKMAATGWKTIIILSQDDEDMISFRVTLPRGRRSY
jgi:hypothetical protein